MNSSDSALDSKDVFEEATLPPEMYSLETALGRDIGLWDAPERFRQIWSLDSAFGRVSFSSTVAKMAEVIGSKAQSPGIIPRLGDWLSFMEGDTLEREEELPEAGESGRSSTGDRKLGVLNIWAPPEPSG